VEAKRMGEAGRKRVEEYFSWEAIADQTIALYRGLVEARGRGGFLRGDLK
jgi:alpha-maltose-1-phosphate synthase